MTDTDQILQKISSGQDVTLVEVRQLRDSHLQLSEEFQIHRRDDRDDFNRVFTVMETNRQDRTNQFGKVIDALVKRMDSQDDVIRHQAQQIAAMNTQQDKAKGAGFIIMGLITFLGTAVITLLGVLAAYYFHR